MFLTSLLAMLLLLSGCSQLQTRQSQTNKIVKSDNQCFVADSNTTLANIEKSRCYTFASPSLRSEKRDVFFSEEYKSIAKRRTKKKFGSTPVGQRPKKMIGLALSGGGMRANAFHLGILAGLEEFKISNYEGKSLLDRIDYISSVSGGSWALGAYLFNDDLCDQSNIFRTCENCGIINDRLPHYLLFRQGALSREGWRKEIHEDFVPASDVLYVDLHKEKHLKDKPYFIINSTHSAKVWELGSDENFNFQFTRDGFGTFVDCLSGNGKEYCGSLRRFRWKFLKHGLGKGFFIKNPNDPQAKLKIRINEWLTSGEFTLPVHVSDIIAASSAVVSKAYGMYIRVSVDHEAEWNKRNGIREQYRLSDGGKSENIGVLPLVERGVQLIIASQMAEDAKMKFEDLDRLNSHVNRHFGVKIDTEVIKSTIRGDDKSPAKLYAVSNIQHSFKESTPSSKLLFIKPTYGNITNFKLWLTSQSETKEKKERSFFKDIIDALKNDKNNTGRSGPCFSSQFPQNTTSCGEYDKRLIYAYYLLGRYIILNTSVGAEISTYAILK